MTFSRAPRLTIIALVRIFANRCASSQNRNRATAFFRCTENSSQGVAGNVNLIVHTDGAFDPTAHPSCPLKRLHEPSASTSGRTMMHHRVLSHAKSAALAGLLAFAVAGAANAQKKYDPGATDTEIKIGNIMPYSGPASAYATIGKTEAAYFNKINAEGGINGRKINFISYDDGLCSVEDRRASTQAG